jgi:2'-5' RNA ligase
VQPRAVPQPVDGPAVESALLVLVPEADAVVAEHRRQLDLSARRGVPAHVTVLYPIPAELAVEELQRVAAAIRTVDRFSCEFAETRWFGDDVLWLAPVPDRPFRALTRAICSALPEVLPYGGRIARADLVPHLTVGDRVRGAAVTDLRAAEAEVAAALPVRADVREVARMRGHAAPDSWQVVDRFPLG